MFEVLDHAAICFLIAGTALKVFGGIRYNTLSTLAYPAMGWLLVIAGTACRFSAVYWYAA